MNSPGRPKGEYHSARHEGTPMNGETLHVYRVVAPVTNLGYGRRIALWVAGCSVGCPGCCSKDTWQAKGRVMGVTEVARLLALLATRQAPIDGFTISGGEPTEAAFAICALLRQVRTMKPDWDVLLYSGLPWRRLQNRFTDLLALCDAVIPEPFVRNLPSTHPLFGSANQSIRCLTAKARARYEGVSLAPMPLEASVSSSGVEFSGVPKGDGLARFTAALARRGIRVTSASWS